MPYCLWWISWIPSKSRRMHREHVLSKYCNNFFLKLTFAWFQQLSCRTDFQRESWISHLFSLIYQEKKTRMINYTFSYQQYYLFYWSVTVTSPRQTQVIHSNWENIQDSWTLRPDTCWLAILHTPHSASHTNYFQRPKRWSVRLLWMYFWVKVRKKGQTTQGS